MASPGYDFAIGLARPEDYRAVSMYRPEDYRAVLLYILRDGGWVGESGL